MPAQLNRFARLLHRLTRGHRRDERGSISVWMIASAIALIGIAGIGTDLSGQVHTKQHAQDIAAQAARVGAEQVSGDVVSGAQASVNFVAARNAAQQYLQAAGLNGSVNIVNGTTIEVTTTETYDTTFLGLLGISHLKVTGDATAQSIRTEGGVAR
ncbi:MAG: pilus assembly protein TadG-related protein [Nocardioidaceae bacterium]